ncbi:MAG: cobyric acid synthase [Chloroflexota bacterium]
MNAVTLAPVLMVQGTASHVGKSTLVAGLCRLFRQDGVRVAPFKAQNMALNSYVAAEGGEIGRSQALQAQAAGLDPSIDMNPILLKPEGEARCQVVVNGRSRGSMSAARYQQTKLDLWPDVVAALNRLRQRYDLVIAEGAGSPAEINLRSTDLANMRVALHTNAAVILVGDIDRGGVFASLLGTYWLLDESERRRLCGFAINKFRGDPSILEPGLVELRERTGIPVLGVLPHLSRVQLPEEDSLGLEGGVSRADGRPTVAVIRLPHIANFDEFAPLATEPGIRLVYASAPAELAGAALVIIPGTKTTIEDLAWLRRTGLADWIRASTVPLIGICGGFQMLGREILDPEGVESDEGRAEGLGLIPMTTTFVADKRTVRVRARVLAQRGPLAGVDQTEVEGYEIHMGRWTTPEVAAPALMLDDERAADGYVSQDGRVTGTYVHGLFENEACRATLVRFVGGASGGPSGASRDEELDRLAACLRQHLDLGAIRTACGLASSSAGGSKHPSPQPSPAGEGEGGVPAL